MLIYKQTQPGIMGQASGPAIPPIQPPQSIQPLSAPTPLIQPPQSPTTATAGQVPDWQRLLQQNPGTTYSLGPGGQLSPQQAQQQGLLGGPAPEGIGAGGGAGGPGGGDIGLYEGQEQDGLGGGTPSTGDLNTWLLEMLRRTRTNSQAPWDSPPQPQLHLGADKDYVNVIDPNTQQLIPQLTPSGELRVQQWQQLFQEYVAHEEEAAYRAGIPRQPTGAPEGFEYEFDPNTGRYEQRSVPGVASERLRQGFEGQRATGFIGGKETVESKMATAQINDINNRMELAQQQYDESIRQFDITTATEAARTLSDLQLERDRLTAQEKISTADFELRKLQLGQEGAIAGEKLGLEKQSLAQQQQQFLLSNPLAAYFQQLGVGGQSGAPGLTPAPGAIDPTFKFAEQFTGPQFPILSPMALEGLSPTQRQFYQGVAGLRGLSPEDLRAQLESAIPPSVSPRKRRKPKKL